MRLTNTFTRRDSVATAVGCALVFGALCGCADGGGLFGSDSESLVIRGTMAVAENGGVCPVLLGEDGFTYHLRQGTGLANELFDAATEIGAVSRLVVTVRNDLPVACQFGTVVIVTRVLEVISPDGTRLSPEEQAEPQEDGIDL